MTATILVVEDEALIRLTLRERLAGAGHRVLEADTVAAALPHVRDGVDLILLDYKLPDGDGLTLMKQVREIDADVPVILMTAYSSIETAVEAMRQGAYDYVNKPFNLDELMLNVEKALETTRLRREVRAFRAGQGRPYGLDSMVGEAPAMRQLKEMLVRIAQSPASTVLLTGDSGTGKDLAAKIIHYNSARADGPFMNITCSAMPEQLLESELFGHERGAFTDARNRKKGLLESAHGGTVFLDEIGELSPAAQAKLLRFLEEKSFKRVGGSEDVRVDVRIISATNRHLEDDVKANRFREDLYWRLRVLCLDLPPLRERHEDIPALLDHFVQVYNREFKRSVTGIEPAAVKALTHYAWPGNIRELRNAVERAMLMARGDVLALGDFQVVLPGEPVAAGGFRLPSEGVQFEDLERDLVVQALQRTGGNQTRAAALLGMNRDQIRYRIEKFGLAAGAAPEAAARRHDAKGDRDPVSD
jgi:DNA-binding NtrC family response regulator